MPIKQIVIYCQTYLRQLLL